MIPDEGIIARLFDNENDNLAIVLCFPMGCFVHCCLLPELHVSGVRRQVVLINCFRCYLPS
jgi:hypothetical protein